MEPKLTIGKSASLNGLKQCFSNFTVHTNLLGKLQNLIQSIWCGAWESAFLTRSQKMPIVLVHKPHSQWKQVASKQPTCAVSSGMHLGSCVWGLTRWWTCFSLEPHSSTCTRVDLGKGQLGGPWQQPQGTNLLDQAVLLRKQTKICLVGAVVFIRMWPVSLIFLPNHLVQPGESKSLPSLGKGRWEIVGSQELPWTLQG